MKITPTEIVDTLNTITNSFTDFDADVNLIELTYDCGDLEDAERFSSKVDTLAEDFKNDLDITLTLLEDEDEEADTVWTIVMVNIEMKDNTNFDNVIDFIKQTDYI